MINRTEQAVWSIQHGDPYVVLSLCTKGQDWLKQYNIEQSLKCVYQQRNGTKTVVLIQLSICNDWFHSKDAPTCLKWQIIGFSPKAGRTVMTNFKLWAKAKTGHFTSAPLCLLYNFKFMLLNSTEKSWIIIFKLNPAVILWARERTEELFWILLKNFWLLLVLLRKCWWTGCRTVTHWHDWLRLTINKETRMSHRGSSSAGFRFEENAFPFVSRVGSLLI